MQPSIRNSHYQPHSDATTSVLYPALFFFFILLSTGPDNQRGAANSPFSADRTSPAVGSEMLELPTVGPEGRAWAGGAPGALG